MTVALYVIVSTFMVLVLSVRLRGARQELARVRAESGDRAQAAASQEQAAYAQALALSLACLLAGMAAWYAPPSARPAGAGRAGNTAGAGTAGPDRRAAG